MRKKNAASVWTWGRMICLSVESDPEGDFLSVSAHCEIALLNDLTAVGSAAVHVVDNIVAGFEGTA